MAQALSQASSLVPFQALIKSCLTSFLVSFLAPVRAKNHLDIMLRYFALKPIADSAAAQNELRLFSNLWQGIRETRLRLLRPSLWDGLNSAYRLTNQHG